jgi:N-acetylmuramoyl-L-alanine amidase
VALTQPAVTRVVLDLEGAVEYSVSQLANPDRVMLEVRSAMTRPEPVPTAPAAMPVRTAAVVPPAKPQPKPFVPPGGPLKRVAPPVIGKSPYVAPPSAARVNFHSFSTDSPHPPAEPTPALAVTAAVYEAKPARSDAGRQPQAAPTAAAMEPRPAQRNRSGDRSMTRVLGLKLTRVVLDPGHGGHDHGTTGRAGAVEKEVVLDVAMRLGKLIEERLGAEVVYTRTSDTFLSLEDRTRIANEQRADLFLSIHANSSPYRGASGAETYYLSFTASKADMEVAARENAGSQRSMHELSDLLRQIALQDKAAESREFAAKVQATSHELAVQAHGKIRNRGVKKAPFVVLVGAQMPSILTEIGFVSNAREDALLQRSDHRQKIAEALYKGVYQYSQTLSHFSVASRASAAAQ